MKIHKGLFDHMVLQRAAGNACDVLVEGESRHDGVVKIRVGKGPWKQAGIAENAGFQARLRGLKAGGPYAIEVGVFEGERLAESVKVKDVLVGDVWLLGGQSNMQGYGSLLEADTPDPKVRAFYMHDAWAVARDPIHDMWKATHPVHTQLNGGALPGEEKNYGTGPGISFGQAMLRLSGVPQGLIACAHGGTSMTQWDPARKSEGGKSLYGAMLDRFRRNGGRARGMIWYQGCSDTTPADCEKFMERMRLFIAALRQDLADPRFPFVMAQISRVTDNGTATEWNKVQDIQRRLPGMLPMVSTVSAIDLDLDDVIHLSGKAQSVLGRRMAEAMWTLLKGKSALKPPMDVKKITAHAHKIRGHAEVEVEFSNVEGRLVSLGRPNGFEVGFPEVRPSVWRTRLSGAKAVLSLSIPFHEIYNRTLHYGYGRNPYCNITDMAGRSLPVFGPLPIGGNFSPNTGFITTLRTSRILPSKGKLKGLEYPNDLKPLDLKTWKSPDQVFCFRRQEIAESAPKDLLIYFACDFECEEAMKLALNLGYDGPVKAWLDGKQVYHDAEGTNPALPEDAVLPFQASPGRHEILVALGTHNGLAWGISLNFARLDVPEKGLADSAPSVKMPVVLG
jgi:sialate O-acetylesterase